MNLFTFWEFDTFWSFKNSPNLTKIAKIAYKIAKSKYFFQYLNASYSLTHSLSNIIWLVRVRLVVQKLSEGGAAISFYSVKL